MNKTIILILWGSGFLASQTLNESGQAIDPSTLHLKVAIAEKITTPPKLDGSLDDSVWELATPIRDMLQVDPDNLVLPTESTEVRILYDNEFLYVGFRNYDSDPSKIMRRLARRDVWQEAAANNADWVGIALDSRDDNRTAYAFIVNAAGVELDAYVYNDSEYDMSWNGVWDVKVQVDSLGWTAEFRIPFFLLWFSADSEQTWGLELNRAIYRKQEFQEWPAKKRGVEGVVSRFGILKGINNVPVSHKMEILPYVLGGYQSGDQNTITRNLGIDLAYDVSGNTTLNATFNPDFGQVEADPSVLNLTAFETFYEEKRLFFVEGGSFFKNRIQLFHSRRIGRQPGYFSPEEGKIISKPEYTTILAAAKLMGNTQKGLEYGLIESVTDEEYAVWEHEVDGETIQEEFLLEPYTNYFAGRVKYPLFNDLSTIGVMLTDSRRRKAAASTAGGLDWDLNFLDNRVSTSGQLALSRSSSVTGSAGRFFLGYNDPEWWDLKIVGGWSDNTFEINDMGFQRRSGTWRLGSFGGIRQQDPWWKFLRNELDYRYFYRSRIDGLVLSRSLNIEQENITKDYWAFGFGTEINFPSYDDGDTFKDERAWVIKSPAGWARWAWFQSDNRKRIVINPVYGFGKDELGGSGYMARLGVTIKPTDNISFSIEGTQSYLDNRVEWVGIDSDTSGDRIVYSYSKQKINDIQVRLNWTLNPDLSFEMWAQPFQADINYYNFRRLVTRKSLQFENIEYSGNPDFEINNAVGTFVLRWEYLSGSTLFIVFNLNDSRYHSLQEGTSRQYTNTLFFKLNYWF